MDINYSNVTSTDKSKWLNPLNKLLFQKAFKKKAPQVVLQDGRRFFLYYDKKPGEVLVKPERGLAPMGYFNLEKVAAEEWLFSGDDR